MTAAFRVVHFLPDPLLGGRVPLAAIVRHDGGLTLARVPHLAGDALLGRASATAVMHIILDDLARLDSFDALPRSVGPQVVLDDPRDVPVGVEDPVEWVRGLLGSVRDGKRSTSDRTHDRHRVRYGALFLKAYGVDSVVHRKFRPAPSMEVGARGAQLGPIAQYVRNNDDLLLLEPLVPVRTQWRDDLIQVTERFAAYKYALGQGAHLDASPTFYAYVLRGGPDDRRAEIADRLAGVADFVVDTANDNAVRPFVARIRAVGGAPQLEL